MDIERKNKNIDRLFRATNYLEDSELQILFTIINKEDYGPLVYDSVTEENLSFLAEYLPKNFHSSFFTAGPECVPVLQAITNLSEDESSEANDRARILKVLAKEPNVSHAMWAFLELEKDPQKLEWVSGGWEISTKEFESRLKRVDGQKLANLVRLKDCDNLYKNYSYYQYVKFINNGHTLEFLAKNNILPYYEAKPSTWDSKLTMFARVLDEIGEIDRPLSQFTSEVWDVYTKIYDAGAFDEKKAAVLLNKLRSRSSFTEIKNSLGLPENNLSFSSRILKDERLEQINKLEGKNANPYLPTIGFEWEFSKVKGTYCEDFLKVLDVLGMHSGQAFNDTAEFSPGPFNHPITASLCAELFYESGIVEPFYLNGNSLHWNVGFSSFRDTPAYVAWLQSTGWAYQPYGKRNNFKDGTDTNETYAHRLFANNQENDPYVEMKSFGFQGIDGFKKHMYYGSFLAASLKAYQDLCIVCGYDNNLNYTELVTAREQTHVKSIAYIDRQIIDQVSTNSKKRDLALIWLEARQKLDAGFEYLNLSKFLTTDARMVDARRFARKMVEVFPQENFFDKRSDEYVNDQYGKRVVVNGKAYPNLVAFSRSLVYETVKEIQKVIGE